MSNFTKSGAYPWALTGIFGAFHLVLTFIPYSVLGMGGGFLTWGMVSAPIVGFLLGPFYGTIAVLIGSLAGTGIFNLGGILGPIVPILAPTFGAFTAGALRMGRTREVFIVYLIAIIGFIVSPIGISAFIFIWLHLIVLVIIAILLVPKFINMLRDSVTFEKNRDIRLMPIAVILFSFIALLADHVVGNVATIYFFFLTGTDAATLTIWWLPITFIYPVERIVAAAILAIVVITAGEAIVQTGLELPMSPWDKSDVRELTTEEIENG